MGHKARRWRKLLAGGHHWGLLGPPGCVGSAFGSVCTIARFASSWVSKQPALCPGTLRTQARPAPARALTPRPRWKLTRPFPVPPGVGLVEHLLEKYIRSENSPLFDDFEGTTQDILREFHQQNCNARHKSV